jgi:hypothetical protein
VIDDAVHAHLADNVTLSGGEPIDVIEFDLYITQAVPMSLYITQAEEMDLYITQAVEMELEG